MSADQEREDLAGRIQQAVHRETQERASRPPDHKIRVLVADDHTVVREAIAARLAKEPDLEVVQLAASCGDIAREICHRVHPDVIVMDVFMEGMDGVEATRRIKAELPGAVIIALSVDPQPETVQAMLQAGADAYLTKFASVQELVDTIRKRAPHHEPAGQTQGR